MGKWFESAKTFIRAKGSIVVGASGACVAWFPGCPLNPKL